MPASECSLDPLYLFGCYLAARRTGDAQAVDELYGATVHPCAETRLVAAALLEELSAANPPAPRAQEATSWIMPSH